MMKQKENMNTSVVQSITNPAPRPVPRGNAWSRLAPPTSCTESSSAPHPCLKFRNGIKTMNYLKNKKL